MSPTPTPSRVIVIFSTKGGTGKTVVATNLAVSLSQLGAPTVLLDCDGFAMGDMASMLHLTPQHSIVDLGLQMEQGQPMQVAAITRALTKHATGVEFLPLIRGAGQMAHIKTQWFKPLIAALRE